MATTQTVARIQDYVAQLELPDTSHLPILARRPSTAVSQDEKAAASVDAGSLVSFVSGLTAEHKSDVLNSTLLAQLAATKKFDRYKQTKEWYDFYIDVLANVGWVVPAFAFRQFEPSANSFTVNEAILEVLAAIATGNELAIMNTTLNSLRDNGGNDKQLSLFENNSFPENLGCFQVLPVGEDDGQLVMAMSAMQFTSEKHVSRFLWFKWERTTVKLFQSSQKAVLNEDIYSKVRQAVIDRLGDNAKKFVLEIEI